MANDTKTNRRIERMNGILAALLAVTDGCRPDMHEPDEQDLTAVVVGTDLDNAFGSSIDLEAVLGGRQEIVVVLKREDAGADITTAINLADLIALARLADTSKVGR